MSSAYLTRERAFHCTHLLGTQGKAVRKGVIDADTLKSFSEECPDPKNQTTADIFSTRMIIEGYLAQFYRLNS